MRRDAYNCTKRFNCPQLSIRPILPKRAQNFRIALIVDSSVVPPFGIVPANDGLNDRQKTPSHESDFQENACDFDGADRTRVVYGDLYR